jgi:hypothetical protein
VSYNHCVLFSYFLCVKISPFWPSNLFIKLIGFAQHVRLFLQPVGSKRTATQLAADLVTNSPWKFLINISILFCCHFEWLFRLIEEFSVAWLQSLCGFAGFECLLSQSETYYRISASPTERSAYTDIPCSVCPVWSMREQCTLCCRYLDIFRFPCSCSLLIIRDARPSLWFCLVQFLIILFFIICLIWPLWCCVVPGCCWVQHPFGCQPHVVPLLQDLASVLKK